MDEWLPQQSDEYLPPELLLDETLPANDQYLKRVDLIRNHIVSLTRGMRPNQVELVKARHSGLSIKDAGTKAGYTSESGAYKALKSDKCQELLGALRNLSSAIEGPNVAQRMNMLYRIAKANEKDDPKTAISAIETMNKMTNVYQPQHQTNNTVNVLINGDILPRTALDEPHMPDGHLIDHG